MDVERIINSLKGISGTGELLQKFTEIVDGRNLTLEPGDFTSEEIAITAPIGYDLWYLYNHMNLIASALSDNAMLEQFENGEYAWTPKSLANRYVEHQLSFLVDKLNDMRTFRGIEKFEDLVEKTDEELGYQKYDRFGYQVKQEWKNNGSYFLHLIAYEMRLHGEAISFSSDGPVPGFKVNDYCGYLTFPVGQLGVMQVISILAESDTDSDDFILKDKEKPFVPSEPEMFPPSSVFLLNEGATTPDNEKLTSLGIDYEYALTNDCFGRHMIEDGYLMPDNERQKIEYPADHIPETTRTSKIDSPEENKKIYADVNPKGWMRYWIKKDDTFPVPGEFIGILVKPVAVPPHVWWFQESTPFVYAGCWFETNNLTSGIVESVTPEESREDGGIGVLYEVRVQGYSIEIESSDFFEYEVGERVGIVKMDSINEDETPAEGSFSHADQVYLTEEDWILINGHDYGNISNDKYIILPIEFFQPEE